MMTRTYTVDRLAQRGSRHALALLLQHIRDADEPFVTYGAIAKLLQRKLRIPIVFPTHVGAVAGTMMDEIERVDGSAPPINALVTRPSGIPGGGFGGYYNRLWRPEGGRTWDKLHRSRKLEVVEEIRIAVRQFADWDGLYRKLYGVSPSRVVVRKRFAEKDGKPPETSRSGTGESKEHRKLKLWAAAHPTALGLSSAMVGVLEQDLLSGDRIDVLFSDGVDFVAVEVKSILSSEADWQRGIYQCIKYGRVLEAQQLPVETIVRTILLTELPLTAELKARARSLGVFTKVHRVNTLLKRGVVAP